MPGSRRGIGADAEDRVATYLLDKGYSLVTRRFSAKGGEVDLIALDGETLVFVEVKYRRSSAPEEALSARKGSRLRVAARAYLNAIGEPERAHRFDLVAVEGDSIRHHEGVSLEGQAPATDWIAGADEDWELNEA